MPEEQRTLREQLTLAGTATVNAHLTDESYRDCLRSLLASDLDFHDRDSAYATHVVHSFPAKFPPQLPRIFIEGLTHPGEVVLDPMAGSGTTLLEAYLAGRQAIGFDIDPLALRISAAKVHPVNSERILQTLYEIEHQVTQKFQIEDGQQFTIAFETQFDEETRRFIEYWFAPEVYKTLFYLKQAIQRLRDSSLRLFFEVSFSSLIITKNGGVSLALDLAHTRPHRAKIVFDVNGIEVLRDVPATISPKRLKLLTKTLRPILPEFKKSGNSNLRGNPGLDPKALQPYIAAGNAQWMPLEDETIDLIVTSPPYASNAIDYMRAHKFSLVWFGYAIKQFGQQRGKYIGGESATNLERVEMPPSVSRVLEALSAKDPRKMRVVERYYLEMERVLSEMYRVLRPGKAAILVVGTSVIRGIDIEIASCLAEIGKHLGFEVPSIGVRNLDRNRRMMPAGNTLNLDSQIQQRMHQESVIGFYKPLPGEHMLETLINGRRLRDISDLPFDLAI